MQPINPAFQKQVKGALAHLHDPAYLGNCRLAHQLLPDVFLATEDRGRLLQQTLREAVRRLEPSGACDSERLARAYCVLYYKYIEKQSNQAIMDRLSISSSTLLREQREAIAAVCAFLKEKEQSLRAPPVRPWPIPRLEHFLGREEELDRYRRQLEEEHLAAIVGPPGAGKTSLGAELAAAWEASSFASIEGRPGRRAIWIAFREGRNTNIEALLETLGLSLAALGQDVAWRFLQAERQKESPLSLESRGRYLLTALEEGDYLLCLDDVQLAQEDKAINSLCADFLQSARRGKLRLLVMSRVTPRSLGFAQDGLAYAGGKPLGGLPRAEALRLLEAAGLPPLPEALWDELYAKTAGLPIFLNLFVAWARGQGLDKLEGQEAREQAAAFVANMVKEQDIRSYLLHEMYETLSPPERRFLTCASVFRNPFNTEDAPIITLLSAEGVEDIEGVWTALADRHIFARLEIGEISLHPLLREYLQYRLRKSPDDQVRIHRRVGKYYEQSRKDALEAAHHYFEAGDYGRAAQEVSENVTQLINAGQAGAAIEQLERLTPHLVGKAGMELRFETAAAREALYHLLGRREQQKAALDTMLTMAKEMVNQSPSSGSRRLAVACNRQARFHEVVGEYAAALAAAEAGQAAAQQAGDKETEAESLNRLGKVLWRRSDYAAAHERSRQALALAREIGNRRIEADSLKNLGNIGWHQGDYAEAQGFYEQALAIWRDLGDQKGEADNLNNLAVICYELRDYEVARPYWEQSLAIWRIIGDRLGEAASLNNLSFVCCNVGEYAAARIYGEQSLAIRRAIGDRRGEAGNLDNLGMICNAEGDHAAARIYCEQSLSICQAIGDRQLASTVLTDLGMTLESLGDMDGAETAYREALALRREIGQAALAIDDVAGLARVQEARGREQEARGYVEECLAHIATHGVAGIEYVFEVYLTCARILEACGDTQVERARAVLEEAHALLMQRACKINDEALRRSYLEDVPANRELARAWAAMHL